MGFAVPFPTSAPSAEGVDSSGILAFLDAIESDPRIEPHGLIIQRHGRRIAEGYWAPHRGSTNRLVYSLSKTFTGTALGLALGEGLLTLDDPVSQHLPEYFGGAGAALDEASSRTSRILVRHIASMSTGHNREMILEATMANPTDLLAGFFGIAPDAEPGTLFAYNQPPVMALAAIVTRLTGKRLVDYLRPRVFDAIGVNAESFGWAQQQAGVDLGFSGVYTNLDAIARLGQLYLDDGVCDGERLLPEGWVRDASRPHVANPNEPEVDWRQGYGFQVWIARHGYRGDGAFGQYMVVLPEHDVVIAMFSCTMHMQAVLDAMWTYLLPAFGGSGGEASTSTDGGDDSVLAARLEDLTMPTVAERVGGSPFERGALAERPGQATQPGQLVRLEPVNVGPSSHRTITAVDVADDHLVIHEKDGSLVVPLLASLGGSSVGSWTTATSGILASSAAVTDAGRVVVDLVMLHTPHRLELTLDLASGTFESHWPIPPLFHAALDPRLHKMVPHS